MNLPAQLRPRVARRLLGRLALTLAATAGLTLAGAPAQAGPRWEPVMLSDQGMLYYDPASVREQPDHKEAWTVLDYRKPQSTAEGKTYLSTQAQVWINCRLQMGRIMHLTYYSGPMQSGREIEKTGMLQEWNPLVPDTPVYRLARKLC